MMVDAMADEHQMMSPAGQANNTWTLCEGLESEDKYGGNSDIDHSRLGRSKINGLGAHGSRREDSPSRGKNHMRLKEHDALLETKR